MTPENLLSGLIGGLIVGVLGVAGVALVVRAEDRRWRRENRGAARLLFYEVIHNIMWLDMLAKVPAAALTTRLSRTTWDAEGVRVASLIRGRQLSQLATAYFSLAAMMSMKTLLPDNEYEGWIATGDGKRILKQTQAQFATAQTILRDVTEDKPLEMPRFAGWLGVSGGGLVRL